MRTVKKSGAWKSVKKILTVVLFKSLSRLLKVQRFDANLFIEWFGAVLK